MFVVVCDFALVQAFIISEAGLVYPIIYLEKNKAEDNSKSLFRTSLPECSRTKS